MSLLAPIALFVYKRPQHTQKCVEALLKNDLAAQSLLYVFSDAPKYENDKDSVGEVRRYIKTIKGFAGTEIIEQKKNIGLANSVIAGVSEVIKKHGRIVVLEDDLVVSPYFLKYMNDGLNLYENEEKVISIHGYIYPVAGNLPETFFLKGADCWGWATWKRGWDVFEPDSLKLLGELKKQKLEYRFDHNGAVHNMKMLKRQIMGKVDSWAIRWHASAFLAGKLTLYPGASLVQNIGMDNLSTHTKATDVYDTVLSYKPLKVECIEIKENEAASEAIRNFFILIKPNFISRAIKKLKYRARNVF